MKLGIINNGIVDFNSFFAYNYVKKTDINPSNTIIIADYDNESKILTRYTSKMYIVSLYHFNKDEVTDTTGDFEQSKTYLGMKDIKLLEKQDMSKIDYIVISEHNDADDDEVDTLIMNILYITKTSGKICAAIELTAADTTVSAMEGVRSNSVYFTFYDEVLGGETIPNPIYPKDKKDKKATRTEMDALKELDAILLCDNNLFYNAICAILVITALAIICYKWYTDGLKDPQMVLTFIGVTAMLVAVLQYIKRSNK